MTFKHNLMRWAVASALVGLALPACDDSNNNPTPSGGSGGSQSAGTGAKAGTGGKAGTGAKAGTGGSVGKAGAGGKAGTGASGSGGSSDVDAGPGDCKGAMDCYSCKPTKNDEFLNHCTEATCNPFDNSKLTKLKNGNLPPIP
jgi:hypothetical protein